MKLPSQYYQTYEDVLLEKKREEEARIRAEMEREKQLDAWAREDAATAQAPSPLQNAIAGSRNALVDAGGYGAPILSLPEKIPEDSPFYRVVVGGPRQEPSMPSRTIEDRPVAAYEPPVDPVQTAAVPAAPSREPILPAPTEATPEQEGLLSGLFRKLGADTPEARSALGSSLIRAGGAMMAASSEGMDTWGALGKGMVAGADGYDGAIKEQQVVAANKFKMDEARKEADRKARATAVDQEIALIYKQAGPYGLNRQQQMRIAALQQEAGDSVGARSSIDSAVQDAVAKNGGYIDENGKIKPVEGFRELVTLNGTGKTQQNVGTYYDPKTGKRYSASFNPTTGRQTVFDSAGNPVTDATLMDSLREDSASRGKANMSDPLVKAEREKEASLVRAGQQAPRNIGIVDQAEDLANQIEGEGLLFNTGALNDVMKKVGQTGLVPDSVLQTGARETLSYLTSQQMAQQLETMRGMGALSDKDLDMIRERVLSGNLSPEGIRQIAQQMRSIQRYQQKMTGDWQTYKRANPDASFDEWNYQYEMQNYAAFTGDPRNGLHSRDFNKKKEEAPPQNQKPAAPQSTIMLQNGRVLRRR